MSFEATAILLAWVAIVLLAFAMSGLLRQIQQLAAGVPGVSGVGPELGSRPRTVLPGGRAWTRHTILLFLDAGCDACTEISGALDGIARRNANAEFVAVYPSAGNGTAASITVLQHEQQLFRDYQIPATPFGVVVDAAGIVVAAAPLGSVSALDSLVHARTKEAA